MGCMHGLGEAELLLWLPGLSAACSTPGSTLCVALVCIGGLKEAMLFGQRGHVWVFICTHLGSAFEGGA